MLLGDSLPFLNKDSFQIGSTALARTHNTFGFVSGVSPVAAPTYCALQRVWQKIRGAGDASRAARRGIKKDNWEWEKAEKIEEGREGRGGGRGKVG